MAADEAHERAEREIDEDGADAEPKQPAPAKSSGRGGGERAEGGVPPGGRGPQDQSNDSRSHGVARRIWILVGDSFLFFFLQKGKSQMGEARIGEGDWLRDGAFVWVRCGAVRCVRDGAAFFSFFFL